MSATERRIAHDAKPENYRKSRRLERDYVRPYVEIMAKWPAPRLVRKEAN